MKQKIMVYWGIGSICLFLLGCMEPQILVNNDTVLEEPVEMQGEVEPQEPPIDSKQESEFGKPVEMQETFTEEITLAVHICGAVEQPGVYLLKQPSRVYEGIEKAGGFTTNAAKDYLNLAQSLEDGMKIYVPTNEEVTTWEEQGTESVESVRLGGKENYSVNSGKININTADETLLCTLPGIGESKAKKIVQYRKEHGPFQKTEDVMKVTGIKEGAYEQIKELITVF